MTRELPLRFKIATLSDEIAQIRRLAYRTFAEEIPQHARNAERVLCDKFEAQNTYAICLRGDRLIGMVSVCDRRPFSLDGKLANLDCYLPAHRAPCEIRLLAVERESRTGVVFRGLARCLARYCRTKGYDLALISGTERQLQLYAHLGCVPFGPRVGQPGAQFQPMYLTLESFREAGCTIAGATSGEEPANFLPGPVTLVPEVMRAFSAASASHRGEEFRACLHATRAALCDLTGARRMQVMLGSGTLANDAVAAQLSLRTGRGLVLTNGEFGDRLVDHASRASLQFDIHRCEWGRAFQLERIVREVTLDRYDWVWAVHCETSTGVVNDIDALRTLCADNDARLCLDCVSSVGSIPADLRGVHLATAVSGKALAALPGVALVFHDQPIAPSPRLPRYLDLGLYDEASCTPFTHSSNLMQALHASVTRRPSGPLPSAAVVDDARTLRALLREHGFQVLADDAVTSPAVTTIVLSPRISSSELGQRLEAEGFLLSHRSAYLQTRNWIQVCLMGAYRRRAILLLVRAMDELTTSSMVA